MKRLFYFSGYRLTVFHWTRGRFDGSYYFNPDEKGREEFRKYLTEAPNVPARLLVDVIEEDFRIETIPHLLGNDRKAVIKRLNDRYHRGSRQYTYYEHQRREKTGRKDDVVLLSALTNVELIQPWLDLFRKYDVPICGIWSLPHVSRKVLGRIDAKHGHVLLISQQVSSNVRQTYFHDGKLITSRSATLNPDEDSYGRFLLEEIDQTARFLTNKRFIGFDEILHIHIIASDEHLPSIQDECRSTPLRQVIVHRLAEVEKKVDTQGISGPFGNGIFAQLCMEDRRGGHYGNAEDFAACNLHRIGQLFQNSAIAMVVLTVLFMVFLFIDGERLKDEAVIFQQQARVINTQYQQQLQSMEARLAVAPVMKSTVDIVRLLQQRKPISPQAFMIEISKTLSGNDLSLIRITGIEWSLSQVHDEEEGGNNPVQDGGLPMQLQSTPLVHHGLIRGRVPLSADNIRQAVDQVDRFADILRERKDVSAVKITRLPIDVRSTSNLTLETGAEAPKEMRSSEAGSFTITLQMEPQV